MFIESTLTVNTRTLHDNLDIIATSLQAQSSIIAVVKANAYGLGLIPVSLAIEPHPSIRAFGVAHGVEAIQLRDAGVTKPIMLLSAITESEVLECIHRDIDILLDSIHTFHILREYALEHPDRRITINLEINTGFNRFGFKPGHELDLILRALSDVPTLRIRSVFTHPTEGEVVNSAVVYKQLHLFQEGIAQIDTFGTLYDFKHFCNSGASDWLEEAHFDAVRLGRKLYMDSLDPQLRIGLHEPIQWDATVLNIQELKVGESCGYNTAFTAKRPTQIAHVNIGYADGLMFYKRGLGVMPALVNGHTVTVVAVYMNACVLDVTGIQCQAGDTVTFFGENNGAFLSSQDVAQCVQDEGCTLTTLLSERIKRNYK